eukprot:5448803-Pyramimonas_sp.AAC.1
MFRFGGLRVVKAAGSQTPAAQRGRCLHLSPPARQGSGSYYYNARYKPEWVKLDAAVVPFIKVLLRVVPFVKLLRAPLSSDYYNTCYKPEWVKLDAAVVPFIKSGFSLTRPWSSTSTTCSCERAHPATSRSPSIGIYPAAGPVVDPQQEYTPRAEQRTLREVHTHTHTHESGTLMAHAQSEQRIHPLKRNIPLLRVPNCVTLRGCATVAGRTLVAPPAGDPRLQLELAQCTLSGLRLRQVRVPATSRSPSIGIYPTAGPTVAPQ